LCASSTTDTISTRNIPRTTPLTNPLNCGPPAALESHVAVTAICRSDCDRHRRAQIVASHTAVPQSKEDDEWAQASLDDWLESK
jgi:hypothetical protein